MDKKRKKISVGFKLINITTEQFAIIPDAFNQSDKNIEMSIGLRFGLDYEKRNIASSVKVVFEQYKKAFIIIEIANHFNIEKKAWNGFDKSEENIMLPRGFATHLVMLTIGTLRGVLHCKTENTEFSSIKLPTINVTEMIKGDVEIEKNM